MTKTGVFCSGSACPGRREEIPVYLKTAKSIALEIPPTVTALADEAME